MKTPLKIAIVGPESTGKTTLTQQLADFFQTSFACEVARDYLSFINRPYLQTDLTEIARLQIEEEKRASKNAREVFFTDTNLLVIKVWSEYKYQSCDTWILENMNLAAYHAHFLTGTDVLWEDDPLREHPDQRDVLYEIYHRELSQAGVLFYELKGDAEQRFWDAVKVTRVLLSAHH